MHIDAAVTEAQVASFHIDSLELGELGRDEVLVEIAAVGICHTDLICRDQWYPVPLPAVLGHEGAGTVVDVGANVAKVEVGDRVAISFNSCGTCPTCQTGRPAYCHDFFGRNFGSSRPDGTTALARAGRPIHSHFFGQSSFATHSIAREGNVTRLDHDVSLDLVAPFGCGIQTGAGAVLNVPRPQAGMSIAVFGVGAIGLAAVMAARIAGCTTIVAVDVREPRLALARELGATYVVDGGDADAVEAVRIEEAARDAEEGNVVKPVLRISF